MLNWSGYGWVYFIQGIDGGPIKIGHSKDPWKRLREFQPTSPARLALLATFPGSFKDEGGVHHRVREHRLHGEWFADHPDVIQEMVDFLASDVPFGSVPARGVAVRT